MSRTDKTKPLWVRYLEHHPRPIHDHRFADCDLPPLTKDRPETHCHWEPGLQFYAATCCAGCSVRSCNKERQAMNKEANRRSRHAARLEARRYTRKD